MEGSLSNYIAIHRKRAGITQRELGKIIGRKKIAIFRHEHVIALPPLLVALRYETLFSTPVGVLFAGMREAIEDEIEERLDELENELQRGNQHITRRQTLDWIAARRSALVSRR